MRIKLRSNVRGLNPDQTLEFTDKTLLVGDSAAGKTRIQNAIELALTASVAGVGGKSLTKAESLLHEYLAPSLNGPLFAEVEIEGHGVWKWHRTIGKKAVWTAPGKLTITTPLRDVVEAFGGQDAKAQAYLLARASLKREDIVSALGDFGKLYADLQGEDFEATEESRLKATLTARQAYIRAKKKEVEGARAILAEIGGSDLDAVDLPALRAAAELAQRRAAAAEAESQSRDRLARLEERRKGLAEPSGKPLTDDQIKALKAGRFLIARAITRKAEVCPLCSEKTTIGMLQLRDNQLKVLLDAAVSTVREEIRSLEGQISAIRSTLSDDWDPASLISLAKKRGETQAAMIKAEAVMLNSKKLDTAKKTLDSADLEIAEAEKFVEALEKVISDASLGGVDAWRRAVQKFLPDHLTFTAKIDPVARFGLLDNGVFHPDPSGAERVQVLIAMAMADQREEDEMALHIPEDKPISAKALATAMRWWADAPGIVLLASIVPPAGRSPKGWTVLDLSVAS